MAAGVYIHIPFCRSRCSYCDFATDIYRDAALVEQYLDALCTEIESSRLIDAEVDTIYFGGGTPSLLDPQQIARVLDTIRRCISVRPEAEITVEMNPATVSPVSLAGYRALGVDRASFGVQTFDDTSLRLLARGHTVEDVFTTFEMLRTAGFGNISFDLIAGLPGQTMEGWSADLDKALALDPEHLSLYILEVHKNTPLAEQIRSGRRPEVDEDLAAEMYELMLGRLRGAGYNQYEISNFSKPGRESRHNKKYWELEPVFGFGVSAHSFDGDERYANERQTEAYINAINTIGSAVVTRETIDRISETIFLGLRLNRGIDLAGFEMRFGVDIYSRYGTAIEELIDVGLLETEGDRLRLTARGRLFSNNVFAEFI